MQLNWHPDAFVLSEEGLIHGLRDTALEVLTQRGVRWMASYRSRDLLLLDKESFVAPKFLAQAMWLHARDGTNIVTQARTWDARVVASWACSAAHMAQAACRQPGTCVAMNGQNRSRSTWRFVLLVSQQRVSLAFCVQPGCSIFLVRQSVLQHLCAPSNTSR